ncbi:alkene reductase [Stenotrophomonas sp. Iso1]|uniref:alkene reductase n=1 Tax=Stenotrophomonas sp. Iso1 TaxID=2977283 RepID=UPI0022B791D3|nr:alkene reductase [Stenotrophomonas sp. Iso1]
MNRLWNPIELGRVRLSNRLAMAPLTRSRAHADGTPGTLAAEYYAQRASFGLIVAEGTQPSADGQGYHGSPGLHTAEHVAGWSAVTHAVHDAGGHIFIQLMHAGRIAHPDNTPHHRQPVAPSAIAPAEKMFTQGGLKDIPSPRALSRAQIQDTVDDHARAATLAIEAGADGVEIHAANGYLIQQFLSVNANQRQDGYGGGIAQRARFALEVVEAVSAAIGADRTGIRLSPGSRFGNIDEGAERDPLYHHLVSELAKHPLAYLHLAHSGDDTLLTELRRRWPGTLILNRIDRPLQALAADIDTGLADMASVGRWALANPDLVARLRSGAALNEADPATFYGGDAHGYTDYPFMQTLLPASA